MTAARNLRTALEAVPDLEDNIAAGTGGANESCEWYESRSQTVIDQYSSEHQFVGSLMWVSAAQARPLLDLVPDTAIWRPQTRWVYELIRRLVDAGTDPTPVCVLAAGRRRPAVGAISPDEPPTGYQHKQLALYLFDAYSQAVAPTAAIVTYAREVLDQAYRRAFSAFGIRMQQLGDAELDRDELTQEFTAIRDELADLWRRAETAVKHDRTQP